MDQKLFCLINQFSGHNRFLDQWMILISKRARYIYLLILSILYLKNRKTKRMAILAGKSVCLSFLIHVLLNLCFYRPRPFKKMPIEILIPSKTDSTFPSKHTLFAFAAAASVFFHERILGTWMLILSALTGFSRVWVGHHYPADIAGSAVLGIFSSMFVKRFSRKRKG